MGFTRTHNDKYLFYFHSVTAVLCADAIFGAAQFFNEPSAWTYTRRAFVLLHISCFLSTVWFFFLLARHLQDTTPT